MFFHVRLLIFYYLCHRIAKLPLTPKNKKDMKAKLSPHHLSPLTSLFGGQKASSPFGGRGGFTALMCLTLFLISFGKARAYDWTYFPEHCSIVEQPSASHPYITLEMIYYDWTTHSNAFFLHDKGDDTHDGPAVWVDGVYICSPDWELAWPGGDKAGNGNGASDLADKYDGFFGTNYTKNHNGIDYSVRFYNPYRSCSTTGHKKYSVRMCVYISKLEVGSRHTVRIRGHWRHLDGCGTASCARDYWVDNVWTTNALDAPWSGSPTATMTNHNTVAVSGNLSTGYGPTTVGVYQTESCYSPGKFVEKGSLYGAQDFGKGQGSFSSLTCQHTRNDMQQKTGSVAAVEYLLPLTADDFTTTFYQWYEVPVAGFVYPKELSAIPDMWKKSVALSWQVDESNGRCKDGTWSIYRNGEEIASGLSYSPRTYTDTNVPDYDTSYNYTVAFIPKDLPTDTRVNTLTASISREVPRRWDINSFTAEVVDDGQVSLKWTHTPIENASGSNTYTMKLERTADKGKTWDELTTFVISSSSTNDGAYTDKNDLLANHTYQYRLVINLLEMNDTVRSDYVHTGGSKLTGFRASRGDYNNMVKLSWTVKQVGVNETSFTVSRRPLGACDDNDKGWINIYTTSGTGTNYSYDDNTALCGAYNEYRVQIMSEDDEGHIIPTSTMKTDGFTYSTGVVSGRIAYGTGTAVEGVKVMLRQQNGDGSTDANSMYSLRLQGNGAGLAYYTDNDEVQDLFADDFSVQMYLYPMAAEMNDSTQDYLAFDVFNVFTVRLWYDADKNAYQVGGWMGGNERSDLYIPADTWSHLTFAHSHADKHTRVIVSKADGTAERDTILSNRQVAWSEKALRANDIAFGNAGGMDSISNFRGYVDELRFFTKSLTDLEVQRNYNHPLAGNEDGLAIYYPLDEGLEVQTIAYDFSKTDGIANGRHATTKIAAYCTKHLPSESQLSQMTYTDINGNYTIRGVAFTGDGTPYSIIPTMGIHEFTPNEQSRFVSQSSLVHSGVDFEDVSSFPVSGKIRYAGTDYPVEDVTFYVDGTICSKDGEIVKTNQNGEYTISVPIGDHFIQVAKSGHVFANGGRFPPDPNNTGERKNFDSEKKGMDFTDETLVNFSGRVVGGHIEEDKPLGFAKSVNNIGVTELTLTATNDKYRLNVVKKETGTTSSYDNNPDSVVVASDTISIQSTAWRTGGTTKADCQKIVIHTDPTTGEFSALVPPLHYNIGNIKVVKTGQDIGGATAVDLSNPQVSYTDSIEHETGKYYYTYNRALRYGYHSEPTFNVVQEGRDDGSFGIDSLEVVDAEGTIVVRDIYSVEDGQVKYKYNDAALFLQGDRYTFNIEGYEEYANYDEDAAHPMTTRVPMAGTIVTINNALSESQAVFIEGNEAGEEPGSVYELKSNQIELDSIGCATYIWAAGFPNVSTPYTRTIAINYTIGDRPYSWRDGVPLTGAVIGSLPTGNNFVTAGPALLDMILRDPPGSRSSAQWTKGTIESSYHSRGGVWSSSNHITTTSHLGVKLTTVEGMGLAVVNDIKSKNDLIVGTTVNITGEDATTWGRTVTATRTISTSDDPAFVGSRGDVFVGSSTNIIFGKARNVELQRVPGTNNVALSVDDGITTGLQFDTQFAYTQGYIEDVLIPNLGMIRNNKLQTVSDVTGYTNTGSSPVYLTTLTPDDPRYGSSNHDKEVWGNQATEKPSSIGPSYTMVPPVDNPEGHQDSLEWCNDQIRTWKTHLETNEREKVEAYQKRNDSELVKYVNRSFDAGSKVTVTEETDSLHDGTVYDCTVNNIVTIGDKTGAAINWVGITVDIGTDTGGGKHFHDEESTTDVLTFSYTLAEEGNDALTVDVMQYGNFSPIFHTRGGQTSNPYEGKEETHYYKPVTTLHEPTMQIEVPQIDVEVPIVSDIPSGSTADYTLRLSNASEIGADVTYRLFVLDNTNPNGAQITVDGKTVSDGRLFKVPGNQTLTKTLQLRQTNTGILDYEDIAIVFASESQPGTIADTVYISAYYVPSSSPVTLSLSNTTLNTVTGSNLTLSFSNFDRLYHNLKAFRLQYKKQGATDWTLLQEYVVNADDKTDNNEMLPATGAAVSYELPMADYSDGNYLFRCLSVSSYGTDEVYRTSDEISLVKDMMRPRSLGQPEPTDGILAIGDELSIVFNEPFLRGELTQEANFLVTGVLNGAAVDHQTALSMTGSNDNGQATAATEVAINLADKDFSIDAWVNINGKGTILTHGNGTNKLSVATDDDGKLVVALCGETFTSADALPKGKWAFLTLCYHAPDNDERGVLNAAVAFDDVTGQLLTDLSAPPYNGNGQLSVGRHEKGAIHELLLWDEAHDMTTALLNRSKTKSPATRHLIGYWKMDEGEGRTVRDYARNRHLTMAEEAWYINNENIAAELDGESWLSITASDLPYNTTDDYAVELWMRADSQEGQSQLLQAGKVGLWLDADGRLMLESTDGNSQSTVFDAGNASLTDNVWHHVALNVLRQGFAAVYVDGERRLTTNAANVADIATDFIIVGARLTNDTTSLFPQHSDFLRGQVDELRVWDATLNATQIAANRKRRLTGREDGLVAYYPFETKQLDDYNQVVTTSSPVDLTGSGHEVQRCMQDGTADELAYTNEAPSLRSKPNETNVAFSFTASDTKVVIDINEDPATIEGCTLNFTVRDVRDVNGNYSEPVSWSAFVSRNELAWATSALSVDHQAGSETSFTAAFSNRGGQQQTWTLAGMPAWLLADPSAGTIAPLAETDVVFTIQPGTPVGKYEETVYLMGNNGIETPLLLHINVAGEAPQWTVNPADYEGSMNVVGTIMFPDYPSEDADDMIAAFIDNECRGVAHSVYSARYDSYLVMLNIYGGADDAGKHIVFKAYDAASGTTYAVVQPSASMSYITNAFVGRNAQPVVFTALDLLEQEMLLSKGWSWMSLYVKADDMSVPGVFGDVTDAARLVKSKQGFMMSDGEKWSGNHVVMNNTEMYMVSMNDSRTLKVTGAKVDVANEKISLERGWNWIAYNGSRIIALADALAEIEADDGDVIKSQHDFAIYDGYEWTGTLKALTPGCGYMYRNTGSKAKTFAYPATAAGGNAPLKVAEGRLGVAGGVFTPIDHHLYPSNMNIVAQLYADGQIASGCELAVFAGDECRTAAMTDDMGYAFLTVPGDNSCRLTFMMADHNGRIMASADGIDFTADAIIGTPAEPLIVNIMTTATAIYGRPLLEDGVWYTPQGIHYGTDKPKQPGVYIYNGQKVVVRKNRQ